MSAQIHPVDFEALLRESVVAVIDVVAPVYLRRVDLPKLIVVCPSRWLTDDDETTSCAVINSLGAALERERQAGLSCALDYSADRYEGLIAALRYEVELLNMRNALLYDRRET